MPLVLRNNIGSLSSSVNLDRIEYYNQDGEKFFKLSDEKNEFEIRLKYVPNFESTRDPERYECILFENPYLTAENDVFEVYVNTIEGRLGWLFPITALDSNENDFANNNSFKHYRHIAYQKLLNLNHPIRATDNKEEYLISDFFPDLSICILSKDEILKIHDFKITDYALSFLRYDYLIFRTSIAGKRSFAKDSDIEALRRGNHKIRIRKSAFDVTTNQYTNTLFIDHVYQTENILTKYILLYQILEQFIQEFGDSLLDEIIKEYQDRRITKNTVREKIGKIQNDRSLVKKTFEKTVIKKETRQAFLQKCTFLFNDINLSVDQNFEGSVYDLRNLITHNYRLLTDKGSELNELIYLFESIIIELLIGFNEKPEENDIEEEVAVRQMEVITEKSKTLITNTKSIRQRLIKLWNNFLLYLMINKNSSGLY